jgi:hypothetical protein
MSSYASTVSFDGLIAVNRLVVGRLGVRPCGLEEEEEGGA